MIHTFAPKPKPSSQLKWGIACVCLLVLIVLAKYALNQIQTRDSQAQASQLQNKPAQEKALDSPTKQVMHLVNIKLPPVPQTNSVTQPSASNKQALSLQSAPPQTSEQTIKLSNQESPNRPSENAREKRQSDVSQQSQNPENQTTAQASAQQIAAVQKGLVNSEMTISLPAQQASRERVITFLYQCVGIGLASVSEQASGHNLMPLTPMPEHPSALVRSISGEISQRERRLQQAYAPNSNLVRVYPMDFDTVLSAHIAKNLRQNKLMQFRAEYELQGRRLFVSNLILNDTALNQTWLLFDGYVHPCRL